MVTRKWVCSVKCWCSLWHKYQSGPNWIILLWLRCSGLVSLFLGGCFQPYIYGCSDFNSTGGELNSITKQPNRFFCLENLQTKSVYSSLFLRRAFKVCQLITQQRKWPLTHHLKEDAQCCRKLYS